MHAKTEDHRKEAELFASALGASESKGIVSLLRDVGYEKNPVLAVDAKATEHILHRQGIGKLKHMDVTGEHTVKDRNAVQGRIFVSATVSVTVSLGAKLAQAEGGVLSYTQT